MKKTMLICVLLLNIVFLFTGCENTKEIMTPEDELSGETERKVDYSEYSFTDISWMRLAEQDTETIYFSSDGSFSYYCACGNPVNDSDLCESYTYDDATKTIELICYEKTENMITTIIIENYSEDKLQLNFDGEIREFVRSEEVL